MRPVELIFIALGVVVGSNKASRAAQKIEYKIVSENQETLAQHTRDRYDNHYVLHKTWQDN